MSGVFEVVKAAIVPGRLTVTFTVSVGRYPPAWIRTSVVRWYELESVIPTLKVPEITFDVGVGKVSDTVAV